MRVSSRLIPWINKVVLKAQFSSYHLGQSLPSTGFCCPNPEVPPSAWVLRSLCLQGLLLWWPCSCPVAPRVPSPSWAWDSPWSIPNNCRINYCFTSYTRLKHNVRMEAGWNRKEVGAKHAWFSSKVPSDAFVTYFGFSLGERGILFHLLVKTQTFSSFIAKSSCCLSKQYAYV